jgi:hypothetical protein
MKRPELALVKVFCKAGRVLSRSAAVTAPLARISSAVIAVTGEGVMKPSRGMREPVTWIWLSTSSASADSDCARASTEARLKMAKESASPSWLRRSPGTFLELFCMGSLESLDELKPCAHRRRGREW